MMILEALELCVDGGKVVMFDECVVSHGYGGLGGDMDGGGGLYACGTKPSRLVAYDI